MSSAPRNDRQAKIAAASGGSRSSNKTLLAGVIGALVVLGIVLALWLPNRGGEAQPTVTGSATTGSSASGGSQSNAPAPAVMVPKGVKDANAPVVASNGGVLKDGIPTLTIFEDFQCPACKQAEDVFGARIDDLAKGGKINLVYYLETFLDDRLGNDASKRAANAALCAADAGKFKETHDKIFAKQPEKEGDGYTDEVLAKAAADAGLSGAALDTWKQCAANKTYLPYLKAVDEYSFKTVKLSGTPAFYVNGKVMNLSGVRTADDFEKKLFETAK